MAWCLSEKISKVSESEPTFFLFGLFVTNREADWNSSMKDIAVSIAAMI